MIAQVESFLRFDKQEITEEGQRILRPKHCVSTKDNKNKNNSEKNQNQNDTHTTSSQKFRQIKLILFYNRVICYYTRRFLILRPHPVDVYNWSFSLW